MLAAIIVAVAVLADQITKYIVVANIGLHDTVPFIPYLMSFYHTRNTGGGFSMLNGGGWERVVLITVSLLAMAGITVLLVKWYKRHKLLTVALAMVLGGALGNMIDRLFLGYVVDFLHTEFMDFPTFNIADCFITIGAILLGVYVIFFDSKVEARLKSDNAEAVAVDTEGTEISEKEQEQPKEESEKSE